MINIGFLPDPKAEKDAFIEAKKQAYAQSSLAGSGKGRSGMRNCPKCGQPTLIRQEGCDSCTNCGHSKCG